MIRTASAALFSAIFLSGCESSNLQGPSDGKKTKNSSESRGDDSADDPVMIGGAHLACVELEHAASQADMGSDTEIACAVNDTATGEKVALELYQIDWRVVDEQGETQNVSRRDARPEERFHVAYSYSDNSFLEHSLRVRISKGGAEREYMRSFAVLDEAFDLDASREIMEEFHLAFVEDLRQAIPMKCSNLYFSGDSAALNKSDNHGCLGWEGAFSSFTEAFFNSPCWRGKINKLFTFARAGRKHVTVPLGGDKRSCVINTSEMHPVAVNYGCYKVPMIDQDGNYMLGVVEGRVYPPAVMEQMIRRYRCDL